MRWQASVRILLLSAAILGAIALPLAVITSVVLGLCDDADFYHAGQVRDQVASVVGLPQSELDQVNRGIVRFFGDVETLPDALRATGAPPDIFGEREILHMNDVRAVVQAFAKARVAAVAVVAVGALLCLATWRHGGRQAAARALVGSAVVTLTLAVLAGALTVVDFDQLFLTFHQITFHNDFWQLDPRKDHLIQMFPFDFWYDAMLTVAWRVLLVTLIYGGVGLVLARHPGPGTGPIPTGSVPGARRRGSGAKGAP